MKCYRYDLQVKQPFDWLAALNFFRYHLIEPVEEIENDCYTRVFENNGGVCAVKVSCKEPSVLTVEYFAPKRQGHAQVLDRVIKMFDLESDPHSVATNLSRVKIFKTLTRKFPGLRVASGWDPFEVAISTILGQLVSTDQARKLVRALVNLCGSSCEHPLNGKRIRLFPDAKTLATADLGSLGTTGKRKITIRLLASLVQSGDIRFDGSLSSSELRLRLLAVPGIGRWSADYIELRGLHNRGAFPATDLILKRALEKHPEIRLEDIEPYQAYAAIYLWREYAESLSKRRRQVDGRLDLEG